MAMCYIAPLNEVARRIACKSGPWGDAQVPQGDEAMPTYKEGWLTM